MIDFIPDESRNAYEYAISACLCGVCCRYDGKTKCIPEIRKLFDDGKAILVCPEVMGGMPTPRKPSEIKGDRVVNCDGEDTTEFFVRGAEQVLALCRKYNIEKAILKQNSPSCGSLHIYDGTFSGTLIDGKGVTTLLLSENGVSVIGEEQYLPDC